jgi:hypothetical protein
VQLAIAMIVNANSPPPPPSGEGRNRYLPLWAQPSTPTLVTSGGAAGLVRLAAVAGVIGYWAFFAVVRVRVRAVVRLRAHRHCHLHFKKVLVCTTGRRTHAIKDKRMTDRPTERLTD